MMNSKLQVEKILDEHPEARNNDFFLCWMWLQEFRGLELPKLKEKQLDELSGKLSTLTRWRRKIQGTGKYLPTETTNLDHRRVGVGKKIHKARETRKVSVAPFKRKLTKTETEILSNVKLMKNVKERKALINGKTKQ